MYAGVTTASIQVTVSPVRDSSSQVTGASSVVVHELPSLWERQIQTSLALYTTRSKRERKKII